MKKENDSDFSKLVDGLKDTLLEEEIGIAIIVLIMRDGTLVNFGIGDSSISDINAKILSEHCVNHIYVISEAAAEYHKNRTTTSKNDLN